MYSQIKKEAIVLDKTNKEIQFKQTPVIQCIGTSNFSLLEVYSDKNVKIQDVISTEDIIVKRITYEKLTSIAKNELEKTIEDLVKKNSERFVTFFNTARPIGVRRHQLDLLPMIGKKHRLAILSYLDKNGPFKSLDDLKKIEMLPDPIKIITSRIMEEILNGDTEKHHLFTMPFFKKQ
jgi:putative nucleotide binding protein